jgi:hypothetical protein
LCASFAPAQKKELLKTEHLSTLFTADVVYQLKILQIHDALDHKGVNTQTSSSFLVIRVSKEYKTMAKTFYLPTTMLPL